MIEKIVCISIIFSNNDRKYFSLTSSIQWEDNIKIDLQEVGWEGMDWIDMAQDRERRRALVNAVMNLRVP
jgi:hypothetical protein